MTSFQFNSEGLILNVLIDESAIFGLGRSVPHLVVPVKFELIRAEGEPAVNYEVLALHCDTWCKTPPLDEPIGATIPCLIGSFARHLAGYQMMLPLDHARLALLESARNGGESFGLSFNLRLSFRKLRRLGNSDFYSHVAEKSVFAQGTITVPKSAWCERVLLATGFGSVLTVEFPTVPLDQCAGLRNAHAALQKAQRLHRDGYYDKAVGECRVALDKFWDDRPKQLRDSWVTILGEVNHRWLNNALTELRREGNDPHHNAIGRHFDQLESQLFIATTTALVALVARSGVAEKGESSRD